VGLGRSRQIELIDVTWSDGFRETFPGPDPDQYITLIQGGGKPMQQVEPK
jgi:hypothetical protein